MKNETTDFPHNMNVANIFKKGYNEFYIGQGSRMYFRA